MAAKLGASRAAPARLQRREGRRPQAVRGGPRGRAARGAAADRPRRPVRPGRRCAAPRSASWPSVSGGHLRARARRRRRATRWGAARISRVSDGPRSVRSASTTPARRTSPATPLPARTAPSRTCRGSTSTRRRREAARHGQHPGPRRDRRALRACTARTGRLIGIWRDDGPKARPEMVLAPGRGGVGSADAPEETVGAERARPRREVRGWKRIVGVVISDRDRRRHLRVGDPEVRQLRHDRRVRDRPSRRSSSGRWSPRRSSTS